MGFYATNNTAAPWTNSNPWLASAGRYLTAPTLFLSGENDTMAPQAQFIAPLWDGLTMPRVHAQLRGGTHCFVTYGLGQRWVGYPLNLPWYGYSECPKANIDAMPRPLGQSGLSGSAQARSASRRSGLPAHRRVKNPKTSRSPDRNRAPTDGPQPSRLTRPRRCSSPGSSCTC